MSGSRSGRRSSRRKLNRKSVLGALLGLTLTLGMFPSSMAAADTPDPSDTASAAESSVSSSPELTNSPEVTNSQSVTQTPPTSGSSSPEAAGQTTSSAQESTADPTVETQAAVGALPADVSIEPFATTTTMDVVIRKRVLANPTVVTGSVATNIGTDYSYTEGAVFRLWTNTPSNAPGVPVTDDWATCTVPANSGTCTITIPNANTTSNNGNWNKRFWVVEETPVAGSPAASTYSNPNLYVGGATTAGGPEYLRRIVGLTQEVRGNRTNYLPMTANSGTNQTQITTSELPGLPTGWGNTSVVMGGSFGAVANSYDNPAITAKCTNVNIAIVVDESGSIGQTNWNNMRTAIADTQSESVMSVLQDKAAVSILSFSSTARWRFGGSGPVAVTAANRSDIYNSLQNYAGGVTNWDDALSTIQNATTKYDLVLFVTDGAPNYILSGTQVSSSSVTLRSLEAPIYAANAIKANGTRIVAVGVGDGVEGPRSQANLRAVSGETPDSDFVQGSWDKINQMLTDVVKAATCTVPVEVSKTTVDGSTTVPYAAGWKFAATKTGDGSLVGPTPANGTTTAGATGTVKWDLNFTQPTGQSADLELVETAQTGWTLTNVACTVDGVDRDVTIQGGAVTIAGLDAGSGKVACTFTNTKVNVGTLAITKAFDSSVPSGSGTSVVFNGAYTCTLGGNTVASGTWSRTGIGPATLTPAAGSPAVNQIPVGASCSATETQPAGSDGLPNSSWEWDTYTVDSAVTIANNQTGTITVTNKAKRVYGNFQVTKVLAVGSRADASNTYSGNWSCTLGTGASAETKTGTWGPIAAGATWTSTASNQIPLGATCTVTSETRPDWPVAGDHSYQWDGDPTFSTGVTAAKDNLGTVTVTNKTKRIVGSATWSKVADGSGALLAGSTWTLVGPNVPANTVVSDCTAAPCPTGAFTDQDPVAGQFKLDELLAGDYTLTENTAPPGYRLIDEDFKFTIDADHLVIDLGAIKNKPQDGVALPLTGGLGRDAFLLGGTLLLLLAAGALVIRQRRARRVQQG